MVRKCERVFIQRETRGVLKLVGEAWPGETMKGDIVGRSGLGGNNKEGAFWGTPCWSGGEKGRPRGAVWAAGEV